MSEGTRRDTPASLSPIDKTIIPPPNRPLNFPQQPHPTPLFPPTPNNLTFNPSPSSHLRPTLLRVQQNRNCHGDARSSARRFGTGCVGSWERRGRNGGRDSRRQGVMVTGRGNGNGSEVLDLVPELELMCRVEFADRD